MQQRQQPGLVRLLASAAVAALLASGLGGCQTTSDITGSLMSSSAPSPAADPQRAVDYYGERYRVNPKDADIALAYGQALRLNGQHTQAAAVLEQACIKNPGNKALLAGWGRALADNGDFQQAFDVLSRAHTPDNPDWRILSVQGTALDQMGRHDEARRYYDSALKIVPGEPSVLSNMGMSYMLSKDLPNAEAALRQAYANPKASAKASATVRQNLALVVGLRGRFAEAEEIVKRDLPPDEAAANVAYLKEMLRNKDKDNSRPRRDKGGFGNIPVAELTGPD